jgi:N4-(beta-N-acetylglucosaminyl)-L-asparaginase
MMRFSPTFAGVMYMSMGATPTEAASRALQPIIAAFPTFSGGVVCLDKNGSYGASTYNMVFQISVMADGMDGVETIDVEPI